MKAAVCVAGAIELREWPAPVPGPGELPLRVSGGGLCGSDILKINAATLGPAVLGHEVVGQVAEVGSGVRRFYHRELTLTATYSSSPAELEEAFALLAAGRIRVDGLISHRLPLGRLGEGVELMRRHEAVKVYVIP